MKNKMDISLGVAVIRRRKSAFSHTVCVIVGWFMDKPMDLNLQMFERDVVHNCHHSRVRLSGWKIKLVERISVDISIRSSLSLVLFPQRSGIDWPPGSKFN